MLGHRPPHRFEREATVLVQHRTWRIGTEVAGVWREAPPVHDVHGMHVSARKRCKSHGFLRGALCAGTTVHCQQSDAADQILKVGFDGPLLGPEEGEHAHPYSVQEINTRLAPWLRTQSYLGGPTIHIMAGVTPRLFTVY